MVNGEMLQTMPRIPVAGVRRKWSKCFYIDLSKIINDYSNEIIRLFILSKFKPFISMYRSNYSNLIIKNYTRGKNSAKVLKNLDRYRSENF